MTTEVLDQEEVSVYERDTIPAPPPPSFCPQCGNPVSDCGPKDHMTPLEKAIKEAADFHWEYEAMIYFAESGSDNG